MPTIKLHDDPKLASNIGYGTRITTKAYIAEGTLKQNEDGTQSAEPTAAGFRDHTSLPYPAKALLALEITTDLEDGGTTTTTAWLPFEPEGTDALVPSQFFPIEGLGSVGLAFRPASRKMPFALGAEAQVLKNISGRLYVADADENGRLLKPTELGFSYTGNNTHSYNDIDEHGSEARFLLKWVDLIDQRQIGSQTLILITKNSSNPFILAGLITFIAGVVLDRLLDWLGSRPMRKSATPQAQDNDGAAAHTNR
jgi:hypothetical protein